VTYSGLEREIPYSRCPAASNASNASVPVLPVAPETAVFIDYLCKNLSECSPQPAGLIEGVKRGLRRDLFALCAGRQVTRRYLEVESRTRAGRGSLVLRAGITPFAIRSIERISLSCGKLWLSI